jgi:hypothetical protein
MARKEFISNFPDITYKRVAVGLGLLATPLILGATKLIQDRYLENQKPTQNKLGGKVLVESEIFTPDHLGPEGQLVYESL